MVINVTASDLTAVTSGVKLQEFILGLLFLIVYVNYKEDDNISSILKFVEDSKLCFN